jgi:hypothetical protein
MFCYHYMFYDCESLKLSSEQNEEYVTPYRIPTTGEGTAEYNALSSMFYGTGGTFTGTPKINTTYYGAWTIQEEEDTNKYIHFEGKDYAADLAPVAEDAEEIQNALSIMSGEGETVVFNGSVHRIDSTKAAQRRSDLVSFIGTIGGNDMKLKIGNNEYSIDASKLSADKEEIRALLSSLENN